MPVRIGVLFSGVLIFVIGSIFGTLVLLYLVICYLAFAPLCRDNGNLIQLDSLFIATTIGLLVSGYLYFVFYRFGFSGEYYVVVLLSILAVTNCYRYKVQIVPTIRNSTFPVYFTYGALFSLYGSFTLIASIKTGAGDYPLVFFGQDSITRLLQARELMNITEFPPERLVTKGISIPPYHVGVSGSTAALSAMTGLAVHKAMFWIISPLLVLGSFSALMLLVRSVLITPSQRFLALLIFIPELQWGSTLNHLLFAKTDLSLGWSNWFVQNLIGDFGNSEYDPGNFYPDITGLDVFHFGGIFCVLIAAAILIKRDYLAIVILAPILVILTAFVRANLLFVVVALVGFRLVLGWKIFGLKRSLAIIVGLMAISVGAIVLLSHTDSLATVRDFQTGFSTLADHLVRSLNHFGRASISHYFIHTELVWIIWLALLFLIATIGKIRYDYTGLTLVAGSFITFVVSLIAISFISIPKVWGGLFEAVWIAIPLCCLALLIGLRGAVWQRILVIVALLPIISVASVHQWRGIEDTIMVAFSPQAIPSYNDNRPLGEALRAVPIKGSVIVSDELNYRPTGGGFVSIKNQMANPLFSSLFGHQMFSSWTPDWWHNEEQKRTIKYALKIQETRLGINFNKEESDFVIETKKIAKANGWTHFLLKLEPDDERARKAEDVPLEKLYQNHEWAVYKF
jgi:hypothetical protein